MQYRAEKCERLQSSESFLLPVFLSSLPVFEVRSDLPLLISWRQNSVIQSESLQ